MPRKQRYRRLQGDSAYYPFGARKVLRQKQRRHARLLRWVGILVLCGAAARLPLWEAGRRFLLLVHHLLGSQQHTEPGRRDIFQPKKKKNQLCYP